MNTKSIKSIATLLGVAVTLNLSALAGPDPQSRFQTRNNGSEGKSVVPVATQVSKAFTSTKAAKKSSPSLVYISTPHVGAFAYVQ
jgi:hypothetical protein